MTTSQSENVSHSASTAEITIGVDGIKHLDVKALLGATNLFDIRMIDEVNAYILGISDNQQVTTEGFLVWENILAKVNLETGEVYDIFRGYFTNDGRENMFVQRFQDRSEMVFTGQMLFYISENKLKDQRILEENRQREASFHAPSNTLVYVDDSTLNLNLYDMESDSITLLYESVKNENGAVIQMPCHPYFNSDGNKVLFQKAGETDLLYENIIGCDVNGKVLFETDKLKRLSDVVYAAWLKEGFYTMQATDQSVDSPSGQATYFTIYDQNGAAKNRFMISGAIVGIQRSPNDSTVLAFRMLEPDSVLHNALGVVDLLTGQANIVHHSKGIITSQDISPSGKLLVWIEDHVIYTTKLAKVKSEAISVTSW